MDLFQLALICGLAAPAQQLYGIAQVESHGEVATVSTPTGETRTYPDIAAAAAAAAQLARDGGVRVGLAGVPMPKGSDAAAIQAVMAPCKNIATAGARWATLANDCPKGAVAACVAARWHDGPPDAELADRILKAVAEAPKAPAPSTTSLPPIGAPGPAGPAQTDDERAKESGLFRASPDSDGQANLAPAGEALYPSIGAMPEATVLNRQDRDETILLRPVRKKEPAQR